MLADAKTRKAARSNERQAELLSAEEGHQDMLHIIEDFEREQARMEALRYEPDLPEADYEDLMEADLCGLEAI